jgi:hypothetical protein
VSAGPTFLPLKTSTEYRPIEASLEASCVGAGKFLSTNENNDYDLDHRAVVRNTLGWRHTAAII